MMNLKRTLNIPERHPFDTIETERLIGLNIRKIDKMLLFILKKLNKKFMLEDALIRLLRYLENVLLLTWKIRRGRLLFLMM